jgi:DNA polymerase IV
VIAPERMEAFLAQLPVEALWGVGPVTAKKLRAIGIEKLVDVRSADEARLRKAVGSLADWLRRLAHGDDPREVKPDRPWKSVSCEDTYPEDLTEIREMRAEIERLAKRTAASLAKKGLVARTVTIKVRYADFTTVTRSHTERRRRATRRASPSARGCSSTGRRPARARCGCWAWACTGSSPPRRRRRATCSPSRGR